jgi:hypothetical protein
MLVSDVGRGARRRSAALWRGRSLGARQEPQGEAVHAFGGPGATGIPGRRAKRTSGLPAYPVAYPEEDLAWDLSGPIRLTH